MIEVPKAFKTKNFVEPKCGYYRKSHQYLHKVIWIDSHGPVPYGYCVHHINGDSLDNNIRNLQLMSYSEHNRIHGKGPFNPFKIKDHAIAEWFSNRKPPNNFMHLQLHFKWWT